MEGEMSKQRYFVFLEPKIFFSPIKPPAAINISIPEIGTPPGFVPPPGLLPGWEITGRARSTKTRTTINLLRADMGWVVTF